MNTLTNASGDRLDAEAQVWLTGEPSFTVATNFGVHFKVEYDDFGQGMDAVLWPASSCCGEEFIQEVDDEGQQVSDDTLCMYCYTPQPVPIELTGGHPISQTESVTEALLTQVDKSVDPIAATIVVSHLIETVRRHGEAICGYVEDLAGGYPLRLP